MEHLILNLSGRVRREVLNGRFYLVAPATIIVPGVLNGSKGPLYYPPDEAAKNPGVWNGFPLVVYHPTDPLTNGHVSASDDGVLDRQGVGFLADDRFHPPSVRYPYGRRGGEAWFDEDRTRTYDAAHNTDILARLRSGRPIELSTGLFTDNTPAAPGSTFNGRPYSHVARNYRPDHVAVLPDQVGACSVADGCGVMVNAEGQERDDFGRWTAGVDETLTHTVKKTTGDFPPEVVKHVHARGDSVKVGAMALVQYGKGRWQMPTTTNSLTATFLDLLTTNSGGPAPVFVVNPAVSEAQRKYLNATFGHDWVKEHGFDNTGDLPETADDDDEGSTKNAEQERDDHGRFASGGGGESVHPEEARVRERMKKDSDKRIAELHSYLSPKDTDHYSNALRKEHAERQSKSGGPSEREIMSKWKGARNQGRHQESGQFLNDGGKPGTKQTHAAAVKGHGSGTAVDRLRKVGKGVESDEEDDHDPDALEEGADDMETTDNAAKKCPECGAAMKDGECTECDYVENEMVTTNAEQARDEHGRFAASATGGEHQKTEERNPGVFTHSIKHPQPAKAASQLAKKLGVSKDRVLVGGRTRASVEPDIRPETPKGSEHHRYVFSTNTMVTTNDSPPGHLAGADAGQLKDAFAAMAEDSGSSAAHKASSAAKERGTARAHGAASKAHSSAAAGHRDQASHAEASGDEKKAGMHAAAAQSHERSAAFHKGKASVPTTKSVKNQRTPMNREQKLATLTANCKCEADKGVLNTLSDETLDVLVANAKPDSSNADVIGSGSTGTSRSDQTGGEEDEDSDEGAGLKGGAVKKKGVMNTQQWLAQQPPEVRETFEESARIVNREKAVLARRLTANVADADRRKAIANNLMTKTLADLRERAEMLPPPVENVHRRAAYGDDEAPVPSYLGGGVVPGTGLSTGAGSRTNNAAGEDDLTLPILTMNQLEKEEATRFAECRQQA